MKPKDLCEGAVKHLGPPPCMQHTEDLQPYGPLPYPTRISFLYHSLDYVENLNMISSTYLEPLQIDSFIGGHLNCKPHAYKEAWHYYIFTSKENLNEYINIKQGNYCI